MHDPTHLVLVAGDRPSEPTMARMTNTENMMNAVMAVPSVPQGHPVELTTSISCADASLFRDGASILAHRRVIGQIL